jgi:hypothetical protein
MSAIVRFPVNGPHLGPSGMLLWSFLAFSIAADRYRSDKYLLAQDYHLSLIEIDLENKSEL